MSSKTFQGLTDGWEVIVLRTDFTLHLIFILLFLQAPHHRTLFFKHKSHNLTLLLYFTVTSSNAAVGLVHLTIRPCITTHCALPQLKIILKLLTSHPIFHSCHAQPSFTLLWYWFNRVFWQWGDVFLPLCILTLSYPSLLSPCFACVPSEAVK